MQRVSKDVNTLTFKRYGHEVYITKIGNEYVVYDHDRTIGKSWKRKDAMLMASRELDRQVAEHGPATWPWVG